MSDEGDPIKKHSDWGAFFAIMPNLILIFAIVGALTGGAGCLIGVIMAIYLFVKTIKGEMV